MLVFGIPKRPEEEDPPKFGPIGLGKFGKVHKGKKDRIPSKGTPEDDLVEHMKKEKKEKDGV